MRCHYHAKSPTRGIANRPAVIFKTHHQTIKNFRQMGAQEELPKNACKLSQAMTRRLSDCMIIGTSLRHVKVYILTDVLLYNFRSFSERNNLPRFSIIYFYTLCQVMTVQTDRRQKFGFGYINSKILHF
ncbi:hypothetical protein RF11_11230 [Thelohanellus kitauei]|uniref:Uncharacterized protein n=1 Tax=Thelohanellus kitauei TaxID=669202 RepID=A0A0C2MSH9_THEKT|nr:hypothetical protein RF11_11230 [Thelohanellus kitauei]